MKYIKILLTSFFIILFCISTFAFSETLKKIEIIGNERISNETIKLFISTEINEKIDDAKLNNILKELMKQIFLVI